MTQRSITYLKGISETGDIANQTLFEDLIDSMHPQLPSLGAYSPTMTFNVKGQYSDYTPTSSTTVTFTASSIVDGLTQWVKIITDGTVTFAAGSGCELLSGSLGLLQSGTYKFGFGSIFGAVQIIVPGTEQSTQLSTPVLTASSQDTAIRIVFSSEDLASTGRELLRSTVNDVQTASSVAGFDGSADYVDDNNGAGLTNGTTYYYWGRNTAPGFTNSAYATDSAAPSASVTQLTQPTGLVATGGNNTVALAYDAIDANADDVSVQRSLTSGSGFATIATISRALTAYDDNTAVNGTTYYYRLIANGSGSYSNSDPSAEASATPSNSLLTNLVSYYRMQEASGSRIDSHGSNDLTIANEAGNAVGIIGNACLFVDDIVSIDSTYLRAASGSEFSFTDEDFSFNCWVYMTNKSISKGVLAKWNGNDNRKSYLLFYDSSVDRFRFRVSNDGINNIEVDSDVLGSPSINTWYNIHAYHDSVNNEIGIIINNGTPDTLAHTTGIYQNTGDYFVIGISGLTQIPPVGAGAGMDGRIDQVGIWNRVLSSQEISDLYNSGSGLDYGAL